MRKLLAALVVLVGLAVLVDFGSAAYAEYRVSRELRSVLSLSADPDVRVNGFPFLTQAVSGTYRSVDVRAGGVPVTGFGEVTVEATLRGVRLPASEVIAGHVDQVVADSVDARVRIAATDLGRYLRVPDLQVSQPPPVPGSTAVAPRTAVVLTGTVDVLGVQQEVSVDARLSLGVGGAVTVTATQLHLGANDGPSSLTAAATGVVLSRLSVTVDPSAVPFGIVPTVVRAEGSEIVVEGTGSNVTVVPGPAGT